MLLETQSYVHNLSEIINCDDNTITNIQTPQHKLYMHSFSGYRLGEEIKIDTIKLVE